MRSRSRTRTASSAVRATHRPPQRWPLRPPRSTRDGASHKTVRSSCRRGVRRCVVGNKGVRDRREARRHHRALRPALSLIRRRDPYRGARRGAPAGPARRRPPTVDGGRPGLYVRSASSRIRPALMFRSSRRAPAATIAADVGHPRLRSHAGRVATSRDRSDGRDAARGFPSRWTI